MDCTNFITVWFQNVFMACLMIAPYIIFTCTLSYIARYLAEQFISNSDVKILLLEGIATAEMCANAPEFGLVLKFYGLTIYCLFLIVILFWYSCNWGEATACPYYHLENIAEGKSNIQTAIFKIWAELLGGKMGFRFNRFLWGLKCSDIRLSGLNPACLSDLQVSVLQGALAEASLTCLCRLTSRAIEDTKLKFGSIINLIICILLYLTVMNYSGGYANPVLATTLKFGCKGTTNLHHIYVYWIGACTGSLASVYIYRTSCIQNIVFGNSD